MWVPPGLPEGGSCLRCCAISLLRATSGSSPAGCSWRCCRGGGGAATAPPSAPPKPSPAILGAAAGPLPAAVAACWRSRGAQAVSCSSGSAGGRPNREANKDTANLCQARASGRPQGPPPPPLPGGVLPSGAAEHSPAEALLRGTAAPQLSSVAHSLPTFPPSHSASI